MSRLHESWEAVATTLGYRNEAEMLVDMYVVKTMSIAQIRDRLGYAHNAVRERLLILGIKLRKRGGPNMLGKTRLGHLTDEELKKLKHGSVVKDPKGFKFTVNNTTLYHEKKRRELCTSPPLAPSPISTDTLEEATSKCVSDAGLLNTPSTTSGTNNVDSPATSSSLITEPMKENS